LSEEIKTNEDVEGDDSKPIQELTTDETQANDEQDVPEVELSLEEQLAEAEARAAEYLDGWQRARAEFANARKRLERQSSQAYSGAAVDFARQLLPVLDDFDRAISNVPESVKIEGWFEGVILIQRKVNGILEQMNVDRIDAVGEPFDPNFHEALALLDADGVESGIVIDELQVGYRLGDRVIRPSLVNVSA